MWRCGNGTPPITLPDAEDCPPSFSNLKGSDPFNPRRNHVRGV